MLPVSSAAAVAFAPASIPTTKEIAPGVHMPYINCGGVHSHPSNFSLWLELGGRGLDTAMMYGDDIQVKMGSAIKASGIPREELFVTTKVPCCPTGNIGLTWCSWYDSEYKDLDAFTRAEVDLRLLGLDKVDLLLLHWPCDTMEDTVNTYHKMEEFALAGKARALGISNFNASAIDALYAAGLRVRPAVNQCGFSIGGHNDSEMGRDYETLAKCEAMNITYSAYSPLGGLTKARPLSDPTVLAIGAKHNKSSAQVALRWVTQQGVPAVTASNNSDYDTEDLQIFDFTLSDDEMKQLGAI